MCDVQTGPGRATQGSGATSRSARPELRSPRFFARPPRCCRRCGKRWRRRGTAATSSRARSARAFARVAFLPLVIYRRHSHPSRTCRSGHVRNCLHAYVTCLLALPLTRRSTGLHEGSLGVWAPKKIRNMDGHVVADCDHVSLRLCTRLLQDPISGNWAWERKPGHHDLFQVP